MGGHRRVVAALVAVLSAVIYLGVPATNAQAVESFGYWKASTQTQRLVNIFAPLPGSGVECGFRARVGSEGTVQIGDGVCNGVRGAGHRWDEIRLVLRGLDGVGAPCSVELRPQIELAGPHWYSVEATGVFSATGSGAGDCYFQSWEIDDPHDSWDFDVYHTAGIIDVAPYGGSPDPFGVCPYAQTAAVVSTEPVWVHTNPTWDGYTDANGVTSEYDAAHAGGLGSFNNGLKVSIRVDRDSGIPNNRWAVYALVNHPAVGTPYWISQAKSDPTSPPYVGEDLDFYLANVYRAPQPVDSSGVGTVWPELLDVLVISYTNGQVVTFPSGTNYGSGQAYDSSLTGGYFENNPVSVDDDVCWGRYELAGSGGSGDDAPPLTSEDPDDDPQVEPRDECDFSFTDPSSWGDAASCALVSLLQRIASLLGQIVTAVGRVAGQILNGLAQLFIPDPAVIGDAVSGAFDQWSESAPVGWITGLGGVLGAVGTAFSTDTSDCTGPSFSLSLTGDPVTIAPLSTCDEPMSTASTYVRNGLRVLLLFGGALVSIRVISSSLGVESPS